MVRNEEPLAARMRPRTFDEFVGQEHLVAPGRALRRSVENDRLTSIILWGPPGSGKTTLAEVIARCSKARFAPISAVSSGVGELRRIVDAARKLLEFSGERTILFIDEIHRFNKAQQDAILPFVEDGTITLIGATTENPSFEVNPALRSRCRLFRLEKLTDDDVELVVRRALADPERGLGSKHVAVGDDTLTRLVRLSDGDARVALTALEMAVASVEPDSNDKSTLTIDLIEDVMQRPALLYDKAGEFHYDLISAFIKSMRGSDPDASVYWLARMLEAGEDPLFVARRMVILAAEDVGLADPDALVVANACFAATHAIGMPEAYLPLTECALYLALAPKSNSAIRTYQNVLEDVRQTLNQPVPLHLRNAVTAYDRSLGYGRDYKYAHDFPDAFVAQEYLPLELQQRQYYSPSEQEQEKSMAERRMRLQKERP